MNADSYNSSLNDLRCIWMTSGLVAYKLCGLEFDCDNCEFDKVFRKNSKSLPVKDSAESLQDRNPAEVLINKIKAEQFDEKLIYLKNQFVMKKLFGNAYYIGINPIALLMLDNINSINITPANNIIKGEIILSIEGGWGKKEFISPINFLLIEKFNTPPAGFSLNKWFAILISNETIESRYNFDQWNNERDRVLQLLKKSLNDDPEIGKTLIDGGEKINNIYQFLGAEQYMKLLGGAFP
ncbi:MAG: hypothetical protein ACM34N_11665 [Ignavibacteria bacterium]